MGRTAETFYSVYVKFTSLPAALVPIVQVLNSSSLPVAQIKITTGGVLTAEGSTTSSNIATLTTATWYLINLRVTSNGTSYASVNGGTEQSFTAQNRTQDRFVLGLTAGITVDMYFDDWVIDDAQFWSGHGVRIATPNTDAGMDTTGASDWVRNSGTADYYTYVDEIPANTTDYWISAASTSMQRRLIAIQDAGTIGVTNSIVSVKVHGALAEDSSTSTLGAVAFRSGSTDVRTTPSDVGNLSYVGLELLANTDPDTGAAWTSSGFNALLVGPVVDGDASQVRCSGIYAIVLDAAVLAPAMLTLQTTDGVSSATMTLSTPAGIVPGSIAGAATPTLSLRSPALMAMTATGTATATAVVSAPGLLVLSTTTGLLAATAGLVTRPLLALGQIDGVSNATAAVVTTSGELSLSTVAGLSTATLGIFSPSFLTVSTIAGVSAASALVESPSFLMLTSVAGQSGVTATVTAPLIAQLTLSAVTGQSSIVAPVQSPALLSMTSGGVLTVTGAVSTKGFIVPSTVANVAAVTMGLRSPSFLTLSTVANTSSPTLVVISPVRLTPSTIATSSGITASVKSPALLALQVDGVSNATLAVKSPTFLAMAVAGLSNSSATLSSPALLTMTAGGVLLVTISEISLGPTTAVRLPGGYARITHITGAVRPSVRISGGYGRLVIIPGGHL